MNRSLGISVMVGALAAGCASNPYGGGYGGSGSSGMSNTTKGAAIGALGGGTIGALAGRDLKGGLIGAAAGAVLGGGIGYYMDRQEQQLRQRLEDSGSGVQVQREGDNLRVIMPSQVTFDFDSAHIRPGFYSALNGVAQVLRENDQTAVEITGHTDSKGSDSYNQRLSEERARAVADYLAAQGVNMARMNARGMGESMPLASNDTDGGRQQNRRVEILIQPISQPAAAPQPDYPPQQPGGYYPPAQQQPGYAPPPPAYNPPVYAPPPAYPPRQPYNPGGYQRYPAQPAYPQPGYNPYYPPADSRPGYTY
ncbi:MAG TPA: OmpA family protein [Methylococcaceae bacterium]|nr:OmpA family protein [Methylococcaceae bacterium]